LGKVYRQTSPAIVKGGSQIAANVPLSVLTSVVVAVHLPLGDLFVHLPFTQHIIQAVKSSNYFRVDRSIPVIFVQPIVLGYPFRIFFSSISFSLESSIATFRAIIFPFCCASRK